MNLNRSTEPTTNARPLRACWRRRPMPICCARCWNLPPHGCLPGLLARAAAQAASAGLLPAEGVRRRQQDRCCLGREEYRAAGAAQRLPRAGPGDAGRNDRAAHPRAQKGRKRCGRPVVGSARGWSEGPGHEVVDAVLGVAVGDGFEGSLEVGERVFAVHFGGGDQRRDAAPASASFVVAGEERNFFWSGPRA